MHQSDYYIGVDIGTTSTKAVAFDAMGLILAKQSSGYPILHPQQNQSEQNPEVILQAVIYCLSELAEQLSTRHPALVSFSAAMHSLILMDENNQPLTGSIIWADNRASELAAALKQTEDGKNYYHSTGVPVHAMSPLCKLLWLKENGDSIFTRAKKFIGIKEFIFYRLFQKYIVDTAIASATGLLNINTLQWDAAILSTTGVDEKKLSQVVSVTHIEYLPVNNAGNWANTLQAFSKTAFVIGSSDGALANLGSGATTKGSMAITIGTSSAARVTTSKPATDSNMRSFCYHLCGDQYIIGGASNNGAIVLQWLKENLLQDKTPYDAFISQAATVVPGSDELLLLPYILGERAPVWNADAKGVYFGARHKTHYCSPGEGSYGIGGIQRVFCRQNINGAICY